MSDDETTPETYASGSPGTLPGAELALDTIFELLANQRRRYLLYTLLAAPGQVTSLTTVIEDVATLEAAECDGPLTARRYLDAGTDLYEWHLPVLADVGVIDLDARHETIRYLGAPRLNRWIEDARDRELQR